MAADPVSHSAAAVAFGLASGLAGAIIAPLGITYPVLSWAACGCIPGLLHAPKLGRWKSVGLFVAAALLSAKFGALGAARYLDGNVDAAQGIAALLGIFFHPLMSSVVKALPAAISKRLA